jgi:hypothetical protein
MDRDTLENWRKIRDHLERVGQTENHYYRRALAILAGMPDPFDRYHVIEHGRPDDGRA